jgi:hypothetical protein
MISFFFINGVKLFNRDGLGEKGPSQFWVFTREFAQIPEDRTIWEFSTRNRDGFYKKGVKKILNGRNLFSWNELLLFSPCLLPRERKIVLEESEGESRFAKKYNRAKIFFLNYFKDF